MDQKLDVKKPATAKQMRQSLDMLYDAFGKDLMDWLYFNDKIIEIEKNPNGELWVDELGVGEYNTGKTMSYYDALNIIYIVSTIKGEECTEENPIISATLPRTGERFEGLIPPIVETPTFAIRKRAIAVFSLDDYVAKGIMTPAQHEEILRAVENRENILVSGSTSSGKSTLVNAILAEIAKLDDRLFVIEDARELQIKAKNNVSTLSNDFVNAQKLLKSSMRMNPKRIIVGEVRDAAALALLMAWNTGHPGGAATIHADSALDALYRLEELISLSGTPPQPRLISRAVGLVIHIEGGAKGRKIKEMVRVTGYSKKNDEYIIEHIEQKKMTRKLLPSLNSPVDLYALTDSGLYIPKNIFF